MTHQSGARISSTLHALLMNKVGPTCRLLLRACWLQCPLCLPVCHFCWRDDLIMRSQCNHLTASCQKNVDLFSTVMAIPSEESAVDFLHRRATRRCVVRHDP